MELPRAVASNERSSLDARSRRLVWLAAATGALGLLVAFVVRPLPGFALAMFGGAGDGLPRYGGLRIVWEPPPGFDQAKLGLSSQIFFDADGRRVVIEIPRVTPDDADEVATLIIGGLEFREVIESTTAGELERMGLASSARHRGGGWGDEPREPIVEIDSWHPENGGPTHTDFYVTAHSRRLLEDTFAEAQRRGWRPPDHAVPAYELVEPWLEAKDRRPYWRSYFVSDRADLDGRAIANASGSYDPNTNRPIVLLDFNRDGAERFGDLTARITGRKLATILGGRVRSAPIINGPIHGGRASITMGGNDPDRMERERDALVKTLKAGALPPGGTVHEQHYVPAEDHPIARVLARIALAVFGGLAGGVLAWLALRFGRAERREVARVAGTRPASPRLAWTIAGIAILYMGTQITLPGVNPIELEHVIAKSGRFLDYTQLSLFALGLTPVITSFVLVEVIFAIVPRWRPLRDRPEGRRKIARVVAILAAVIVAAQSYFVAVYIDSLSRGSADIFEGPRWLVMASLVGGTMLLVIVASMIGSRGIGNGYAVLIVAQWIGQIPWDRLVDVRVVKLAFATIALVAVIGIAVVMLRRRVRGIRRPPLPLPISGMSPIVEAGGLAILVFQLVNLGVVDRNNRFAMWMESIDHQLVFAFAALVAWAAIWAFVFARPGRRKAELARAGLEPVDRASWLRALALGTAMLAAMFAIDHVARRIHPLFGTLFDTSMLLLTAATVLDVIGELRDRRRELVPVWPLHDPLLVDVARDRLTAADIPHHMQAAHARSLLWLFGPHIPVMVLVPPEHAKAAEANLRELLG